MSSKAGMIVVMGVSGCGKSTLGQMLAGRIGARFIDGDDLHTDAARAKMSSGTPLTDEDRFPWLDKVGEALKDQSPTVVACSALKRVYRDRIRTAAGGDVLFLHMDGPSETILDRLSARKGHFMPTSLLGSQLALLEPPDTDEWHAKIDIRLTPEEQANAAQKAVNG